MIDNTHPLNHWTDGATVFVCECEPASDGLWVVPIVTLSRVKGASYRPYQRGSPAWRYRANQRLARLAYANLERNQSRTNQK